MAVARVATAEHQPYSRYESIVERQMFGPPPEGFDPTRLPSEAVSSRAAAREAQQLSKEQEKLKSAIHFSMINVTPSGETAVGFTDSSDSKNPINYYLRVGESRNGWLVKEADPVASSMTIVKGDVEVSLTIGGNSAKGSGTTSSSAAREAGARPGLQAGQSLGSIRARRNQRRAEEDARLEEQRKQLLEQQAAFEKRQQEDRQAREEEKAQQEAQREEQRKQLLQIQEELKRAREERKASDEEKADSEEPQS